MKNSLKSAYTLLLLFTVQLISAQSFVINNVTVFDGEKVMGPTSVLVENGMIAKVSNTIGVRTQQIDGSGKFLMPAMTNSHVHAWAPTSLSEAAKAGVVNLLDMHGVEMAQGMMKSLRDSTNFARYYVAGAAATAPGGHGTQYGFPTPTLTTPEEATPFVTDRWNAGAHYLKIIVEPWKETLTHETVKALIDAAHAREMNAVVHISKAADAKQVLQNNANGLVHMWWDQEVGVQDLITLKKDRDFFIMPTLLTSQLALANIRKSAPENSFMTDAQLSHQVKLFYDAGIPLLAGTDPPNANINYGTDLYKELDLLSKAGIPNLEVLKSATSLPAKYFKLGKTGSIKPGYKADLILLKENPLNDIQNISTIETVWKDGKVVARD